MAKNRVTDKGDFIKTTFTSDALAGDLVNYGGYYGVSENDVAAGTENIIMITGRYRVTKDNTTAISQGAKVYFEGGKVYATDDTGSRPAIGKAVLDAADVDEEIVIDLYPTLY